MELKLTEITLAVGKGHFKKKENDLIDVFALDSISSVATRALSALPGAVREAGALDSSEAGVGQAAI